MGIHIGRAIFIAFIGAIGYGIYSTFFAGPSEKVNIPEKQFFGSGKLRKDDPTIRRFKINVADVVLQDLKKRLEQSRIGHEQLEDVPDFEYGFNLKTLKTYRDYWLNKYDWRKFEAILNGFPQFTTEIDGLKIHFLHVKPPAGKYKKVIPLLIIHGWPGNVFEFYKIIPMLTDPNANLGTQKFDFAFEVVAPSIPGYGWSEQPHKRGFSQLASARIFNTLMIDRLNFEKYVVQGGDWGSLNSIYIGQLFEKNVFGVHVNMALGINFESPREVLASIIGSYAPSLVFSRPESANFSLSAVIFQFAKESGYFHIQITKPDTVGIGLNDSPIGLMSYVLEKFSTWTNPSYVHEADGGLEKKFTKDELLTIATIYWVNGNILSSQRYYREHFMDPNPRLLTREYLSAPTGIATFPHDIVHSTPYEFLKSRYNLTHYSVMTDGGHFAAFEVPKLLADDIFTFVKKLNI